jgi:hypothetical protein
MYPLFETPRRAHRNIMADTETLASIAETMELTRRHMTELRQSSLNVRMRLLFDEMNNLGNYTSVEWFSNLTRNEMVILYTQLSELWRFRAQIPLPVKMHICPMGDPFYDTMPHHWTPDNISVYALVHGCLSAMENMICTGMDIEYRKLGALHVLTALTTVSLPARNSMIWLYESIA